LEFNSDFYPGMDEDFLLRIPMRILSEILRRHPDLLSICCCAQRSIAKVGFIDVLN